MMATASTELRVLLRTATARDAVMAAQVLQRAGMHACSCASSDALCSEMEGGAGALLVAEEMLGDPGFRQVVTRLRSQPDWSDLPVLILARTGADSSLIAQAMDMLANVTVIERPLRIASLVSALRSALAARERQYQLREVLQGLRDADQRKTQFLATLAHELRNPLAPLATTLAILNGQDLSAAQCRSHYDMMGRQINHMVRLIDDLMEVSRITRGKIELRTEPLALEDVIHEAVDLSRPLIDAARHRLQLHLPALVGTVLGDRVRLTQVFANLLNNAAKYTAPGGQIDVYAQCADGRATIRVVDNGAGISPAMLGSVFDMFVQVSDTSRAAQGGLGIGLTLARSLVELHGGSVQARSAGLGHGTELVVELPLLAATDHAAAAHASGAATGNEAISRNILVVDDNRDAADSLGLLLRIHGARANVAYNGAQALELAAAQRPSIAILDIGMPGMDGCELARRLRGDPVHTGMLLVALTGWGQAADKERIMAAGFDHHLLKPVDISELTALVEQPRGG